MILTGLLQIEEILLDLHRALEAKNNELFTRHDHLNTKTPLEVL